MSSSRPARGAAAGGQIGTICLGWYLAQSYSRVPDSDAVNLLAMGVVTLGVALVGIACYSIGYERGRR